MTRNARAHRIRRPVWVPRLVLAAACVAIVVPVLALPTGAGAVPVPWRNCGSAGDAVSIQRFDASVWPPQAGQPLTLSYRLTLSRALTTGSLEHVTATSPSGEVSGWLGFQLPIAQLFSFGLRGHRAAPGRPLPLRAGPYGRTLTVNVPSWEPVGTTDTVDLNGYDADGNEVLCMQLTLPIK